jgi:hypothetical protein
MAKKAKRTWLPSPSRSKKPAIPAALKAQVGYALSQRGGPEMKGPLILSATANGPFRAERGTALTFPELRSGLTEPAFQAEDGAAESTVI